jgi:hypothetical protein
MKAALAKRSAHRTKPKTKPQLMTTMITNTRIMPGEYPVNKLAVHILRQFEKPGNPLREERDRSQSRTDYEAYCRRKSLSVDFPHTYPITVDGVPLYQATLRFCTPHSDVPVDCLAYGKNKKFAERTLFHCVMKFIDHLEKADMNYKRLPTYYQELLFGGNKLKLDAAVQGHDRFDYKGWFLGDEHDGDGFDDYEDHLKHPAQSMKYTFDEDGNGFVDHLDYPGLSMKRLAKLVVLTSSNQDEDEQESSKQSDKSKLERLMDDFQKAIEEDEAEIAQKALVSEPEKISKDAADVMDLFELKSDFVDDSEVKAVKALRPNPQEVDFEELVKDSNVKRHQDLENKVATWDYGGGAGSFDPAALKMNAKKRGDVRIPELSAADQLAFMKEGNEIGVLALAAKYTSQGKPVALGVDPMDVMMEHGQHLAPMPGVGSTQSGQRDNDLTPLFKKIHETDPGTFVAPLYSDGKAFYRPVHPQMNKYEAVEVPFVKLDQNTNKREIIMIKEMVPTFTWGRAPNLNKKGEKTGEMSDYDVILGEPPSYNPTYFSEKNDREAVALAWKYYVGAQGTVHERGLLSVYNNLAAFYNTHQFTSGTPSGQVFRFLKGRRITKESRFPTPQNLPNEEIVTRLMKVMPLWAPPLTTDDEELFFNEDLFEVLKQTYVTHEGKWRAMVVLNKPNSSAGEPHNVGIKAVDTLVGDLWTAREMLIHAGLKPWPEVLRMYSFILIARAMAKAEVYEIYEIFMKTRSVFNPSKVAQYLVMPLVQPLMAQMKNYLEDKDSYQLKGWSPLRGGLNMLMSKLYQTILNEKLRQDGTNERIAAFLVYSDNSFICYYYIDPKGQRHYVWVSLDASSMEATNKREHVRPLKALLLAWWGRRLAQVWKDKIIGELLETTVAEVLALLGNYQLRSDSMPSGLVLTFLLNDITMSLFAYEAARLNTQVWQQWRPEADAELPPAMKKLAGKYGLQLKIVRVIYDFDKNLKMGFAPAKGPTKYGPYLSLDFLGTSGAFFNLKGTYNQLDPSLYGKFVEDLEDNKADHDRVLGAYLDPQRLYRSVVARKTEQIETVLRHLDEAVFGAANAAIRRDTLTILKLSSLLVQSWCFPGLNILLDQLRMSINARLKASGAQWVNFKTRLEGALDNVQDEEIDVGMYRAALGMQKYSFSKTISIVFIPDQRAAARSISVPPAKLAKYKRPARTPNLKEVSQMKTGKTVGIKDNAMSRLLREPGALDFRKDKHQAPLGTGDRLTTRGPLVVPGALEARTAGEVDLSGIRTKKAKKPQVELSWYDTAGEEPDEQREAPARPLTQNELLYVKTANPRLLALVKRQKAASGKKPDG